MCKLGINPFGSHRDGIICCECVVTVESAALDISGIIRTSFRRRTPLPKGIRPESVPLSQECSYPGADLSSLMKQSSVAADRVRKEESKVWRLNVAGRFQKSVVTWRKKVRLCVCLSVGVTTGVD